MASVDMELQLLRRFVSELSFLVTSTKNGIGRSTDYANGLADAMKIVDSYVGSVSSQLDRLDDAVHNRNTYGPEV